MSNARRPCLLCTGRVRSAAEAASPHLGWPGGLARSLPSAGMLRAQACGGRWPQAGLWLEQLQPSRGEGGSAEGLLFLRGQVLETSPRGAHPVSEVLTRGWGGDVPPRSGRVWPRPGSGSSLISI